MILPALALAQQQQRRRRRRRDCRRQPAVLMLVGCAVTVATRSVGLHGTGAAATAAFAPPCGTGWPPRAARSRRWNAYDDWRASSVPPPRMPLSPANVERCLAVLEASDYGAQMFGSRDRAAAVGVTGALVLAEVAGPEVLLTLSGAFWHRRSTVLGRAAAWLHACMPEISSVAVPEADQLEDLEEIRDEISGEIVFVRDKRAPDFNGDRAAMEYQGMDPDVRGPFPS